MKRNNYSEMKDDRLMLRATDLSELLQISVGSSYRIIKKLNVELEEKGYIVIAGRIPTKYFEKRFFNHSS